MKSLAVAFFYLGCIAAGISVSGQVATEAIPAGSEVIYNRIMDDALPYLSPAQRTEFETDLYAAINKNPDLLKDGMTLLGAANAELRAAGPERDAYLQKARDYEARLRVAMTKEDPDVGAIFQEIDAHLPMHP